MNYIVGVMPLFDEKKESIWMLPQYLDLLEQYNLIPFIFPYTTNKTVLSSLLKQVDGLLFTGGHDIDPNYYQQSKTAKCGETLEIRDKLEQYLFQEALAKDIPMLGICRGLQLFNVFSGGTLYQDLPTQYQSEILHAQKPPYDRPIHKVRFPKGSDFENWIGEREYMVNSFHHQAIHERAANTEILAISEDGLVEGIKIKGLSFAYAVQWHPEYMDHQDKLTESLLKEFHSACQDYSFVKGK